MILSVLAVALGMAPSAAAVPPDIVEDEFDFEDFPVGDCETFVILGSAHVRLKIITFFDRDGDPETVQIHVLRRGIFANSVTGDPVTDWGDFVVILDFEAAPRRTSDWSSSSGMTAETSSPWMRGGWFSPLR